MSFPTHCDRCRKPLTASTMSMFNTDTLCMECKERETQHAQYHQARDADIAEIKKGNYNFAGIGKPSDL